LSAARDDHLIAHFEPLIKIDAADVAVSAAFRELDRRWFPAIISGILFAAIIASALIGDNNLLREIRQQGGNIGVLAAVLSFFVFGGRWLQANARYDNAVRNSHALNLSYFKPFEAWYMAGSVAVQDSLGVVKRT
jgi:hypothetical protein